MTNNMKTTSDSEYTTPSWSLRAIKRWGFYVDSTVGDDIETLVAETLGDNAGFGKNRSEGYQLYALLSTTLYRSIRI